jgi:Rod binding domain-containing protein
MRAMGVSGAVSEPNAPNRSVPEPRLVKAAHQFEAMMMKELLAPMSRVGSLMEDSSGEDTGILGEFATESLAGALSAGGGLGIADRIVHSLSRSGNSPVSVPVTGTLQIDTGVSAGK